MGKRQNKRSDHNMWAADKARLEPLLEELGQLFACLQPSVGPTRFRQIEQTLTLLCGNASDAALARLGEAIAPLSYSPHQLIKTLAFHDSDLVAAPVVTASPVLAADDLTLLIKSMPAARAALVARRSTLSAAHSGLLIARGVQLINNGGGRILHTIAGNTGAELSVLDMVRLADQARRDPRLVSALSKRSRLPMAVVDQLAKSGLAHVQNLVAPKPSKATQTDGRMMSLADLTPQYGPAEEELRPLIASQTLSESHLEQFALKGDFVSSVLTLAYLTKSRRSHAEAILTAETPEELILLARVNGLTAASVEALLQIGPWRNRLSRLQRQAAMNHFKALTPTDARMISGQVAA